MRPLIAMLVVLTVVPVAAAVTQEASDDPSRSGGALHRRCAGQLDRRHAAHTAGARARREGAGAPPLHGAREDVEARQADRARRGCGDRREPLRDEPQRGPDPAAADLRLERDATVAQLKSVGILTGPLHAGYTTLPAGKAVELRYHARYGAGTPEVSLVQFVLVHAGKTTVLTYTTLPKLERTYQPVFGRSARSFRYL